MPHRSSSLRCSYSQRLSHGFLPWCCCLWVGLAVLPRPAAAVTIWDVGIDQGHVDVREDLPSAAAFFREYVAPAADSPFAGVGKPVLFRGAATRMPAFNLWSDDYLRKKHGRVLLDQVETEKAETRTVFPHEDWTLSKFLDNYNSTDVYSTAKTPKGLSDEVFLLPLMTCGGHTRRLQATVLWFSSGGTKSVIHTDGQHNVHCMFAGEKRWILWHPRSGINKRSMGWVQDAEAEAQKDPTLKDAYGSYAARIKVDDVDIKRFPGWTQLKRWTATLAAGDCMFLPPQWFHYVEAPAQRAISVHVWFEAPDSFDEKACQKLQDAGYNISDQLIRLSDCTWGYGEDPKVKSTKCKIRAASKKPAAKSKATDL